VASRRPASLALDGEAAAAGSPFWAKREEAKESKNNAMAKRKDNRIVLIIVRVPL